MALSTLLGLDEQPGELAGHGPIPASLARQLAADQTGTWRRLVTDPLTGALLDYARTTYRPPRDLAEFVTARDRTCRFPGCQRDARRGDLDHTIPWQAGGSTGPQNLTALCRRHHLMKHQAGWSYTTNPDRSTVWTSPTGHHYRLRHRRDRYRPPPATTRPATRPADPTRHPTRHPTRRPTAPPDPPPTRRPDPPPDDDPAPF